MARFLNKIFGRSGGRPPDQIQKSKDYKKKISKMPISEMEYVAFDTELTGLDFKRDSIISIGAVKLQGGLILPAKTFYCLVKPESELNHKSVVVHEITHADLDKASPLLNAITDFIDFIEGSVLIGHFVHIDLNFVNRALKKAFGYTLYNKAIDTSSLHDWLYDNNSRFAKHFRGKTTKTDLFSLAQKYSIPVDKAHNAFSDAYVTAQLFQRLIHFVPECGIKTVKDLLDVSRP